MEKLKLHPWALGMSIGLLWGLSILLMGLMAHYLEYGVEFVSSVGTLYIGYEKTILGSFIGGGFGFLDGFIMGVLIAWLYNCFSGCKSCK
jgi:hypothetical protein